MAQDNTVQRVLVMFKCHLDVGFTDTEEAVLRRYHDVHLPGAINVANQMREESDDRYVWTVPAWLLHRHLDHAGPTPRRRAEQAIQAGDLAWHALPFTWYTELLDRSTLEAALGFSAALDQRFGRRTTAARLTDVPGHTRGLVGPLADAGVTFLDIGVNPGCRAPDVPHAPGAHLPASEADQPDPDQVVWHDAEPVHADQGTPAAERRRLTIEGESDPRTHLFRWQDHQGRSVNVLYHPRSYGSTVRLPTVPVAFSMRVHGDNLGPHSVASVRHAYASLRAKFPQATVAAATLSQMAAEVQPLSQSLPLVTQEIGDTWIYGTGADPAKTSALREVLRTRTEWVDSGRLEAGGAQDLRLLGELIPAPEHNWGLSTSVYLRSRSGYRTDELDRSRREDPMFAANDLEWDAKRRRPRDAVLVLPAPLREEATERLDELSTPAPSVPATLTRADHHLANDTLQATISADTGAISALVDLRTGRQWALGSGLGGFSYQGFGVEDYRRYAQRYNHAAFTANDFGKPGLDRYPAEPLLWRPGGASMGHVGQTAVHVELETPPPAVDRTRLTAWPARVTLRYTLAPDEAAIDLTCWVTGKTANRRPEALWLSFLVAGQDRNGWRMDKAGERIDPHDVIDGGGRYLHGVGRGATYRDAGGGFDLESLDAHLVSPGGFGLLRFDDEPLDLTEGMHVNLYNNLWGTAFPQWYDLDMRFRFRVRLHESGEARR